MTNLLMFAVDDANGFGLRGDLPWGRTIKPDLKRFKDFTMGRVVFAGSKTIATLPELKGRMVCKLTRDPAPGFPAEFSLDEALTWESKPKVDKFFIGGAQIIWALNQKPNAVKQAFVSVIRGTFEADVQLDLNQWQREGGWRLAFQVDTPQVTFKDFVR